MRVILACGIVALALTGCSKSESGGNAPVKREAGSWKNKITIDKFDLPGAPPEAKTMMEGMMQAASAVELCLSPEAAAKEDLAAEMSKGQAGKDCTFSKKDVNGGTIAVEGVCKDAMGQQVQLSLTGNAEPKKTDMVINIKGKGPGGQDMTMAMHAVSEWTGACKPGQPPMTAQ